MKSLSASALLVGLLLAGPARAQQGQAAPSMSACTGRLTGAITGTFDCQVQATWDARQVVLVVEAQAPVAGVRSMVPARLVLPFPLESRTYGLSSMLEGEARLALADGREYVASGARGELTLDVNALERYQKPRQRYQVTGTIRGRLVAARPDGAGEVHVELRF